MQTVKFEDSRITPSKIVCLGRNYVEHIQELNNETPEEPLLFIKPNSAISDTLKLPTQECRFEGEISFLVRGGHIAGVGFGLDLTLSAVQNSLKTKGLPWEKSKAFDSSAVFSKFVPIDNMDQLRLELWINGVIRQNGSITMMIYQPLQLLLEIKKYFTLDDNDIVMTGTPKGVSTFNKGDRFLGKIYSGELLLVEQEWSVL